MDFYELRHFCATHLLELGLSPADVAVQLGHTDGGQLVMSTYGHPFEDAARERLKRAFASNVAPLRDERPKRLEEMSPEPTFLRADRDEAGSSTSMSRNVTLRSPDWHPEDEGKRGHF